MDRDDVFREGRYAARVSGRWVTVRIMSVDWSGKGWDAINERTGRLVRIKSAGELKPLSPSHRRIADGT